MILGCFKKGQKWFSDKCMYYEVVNLKQGHRKRFSDPATVIGRYYGPQEMAEVEDNCIITWWITVFLVQTNQGRHW